MSLNFEFSKTVQSSVMAVLKTHASDVNIGDGFAGKLMFGRKQHPGYAEFRNGWFRIDVPLTDSGPALPASSKVWATLVQARDLLGAKFVMPAGGQQLAVRAEFPVHDIEAANDAVAETRTRNACQAIANALETSKNKVAPGLPSSDAAAEESELQDQLSETGWQFSSSSNGRIRVELEVVNGSYQADVICRPDSICLSAEVLMAGCQEADEVCRHALGILLLRAGSEIRMAGAVACSTTEEVVPCFQIVLPPPPSATLLNDALGALSVICELFATEAELLIQDPELARAYLAMQGVAEFQ